MLALASATRVYTKVGAAYHAASAAAPATKVRGRFRTRSRPLLNDRQMRTFLDEPWLVATIREQVAHNLVYLHPLAHSLFM